MGERNWKSAFGIIIGSLTGFFWLFLGITKFIIFPESWEELIKGMLIGGIVMISSVIGVKNKLIGGLLLIIEGLVAISFTFFNQGTEAMMLSVLLGVPLFLTGVLFLLAKE